MMQINTEDMQSTINEMMVEARHKRYSIREIPWSGELLCAVMNTDPKKYGEVNFYRAYPERFRYNQAGKFEELSLVNPRLHRPINNQSS